MTPKVKEILKRIKNEPDSWTPIHNGHRYNGIQLGNMIVDNTGNTKMLSVVHVTINDVRIDLEYWECYRLESAVLNWYKKASLSQLTKLGDS